MNNGPRANCKYILSIDIGIKHLALILVECTDEYIYEDIIWFDLIDITKFQHLDAESKKTCHLYHTKTIADWLSHVMYLHSELFDMVDHVLIERQPPQGHTSVEQLLFFKYREKSVLMSPRSIHKFFGWSITVDYNQRKEKSVEILKYRLCNSTRPWLLNELNRFERQHDISDAFLQVVFFLHHKYIQTKIQKDTCTGESNVLSFLDKFRFQKYYVTNI